MERTRRRVGRPPKAEALDTKAALLAAALTLFARHGYTGTSIRAIAREVGLSESVLYAHFADKQAIYHAVLTTAGPQSAIAVLEGMDEALGRTDPAGFVAALAERLFRTWDDLPSRQLASLIARDGLLHDAALNDGIESAVATLAETFTGWLADGRIRAGAGSAQDLAFALLAPLAHARILWLHAGASAEQREAAGERFARHAGLFAATALAATPRE